MLAVEYLFRCYRVQNIHTFQLQHLWNGPFLRMSNLHVVENQQLNLDNVAIWRSTVIINSICYLPLLIYGQKDKGVFRLRIPFILCVFYNSLLLLFLFFFSCLGLGRLMSDCRYAFFFFFFFLFISCFVFYSFGLFIVHIPSFIPLFLFLKQL